ncbi:hypothetical protein [Staphylococcus epidermidis]|uniref:hypothetical protein n=1 Tax=Staphylococcus epidermidis TaxID=1282 RepID=UPI002739FDDF|nr:hypothetical protein [Staphylococcus epidermidis]
MAIAISIISICVSIATFIWNYNRNKFKMNVKIEAIFVKPYISKDKNPGYIIIAHFENNSANPISIGSISANGIYSVKTIIYGKGEHGQKVYKPISPFPLDLNPYQIKRVKLFIPNAEVNENKDETLTLKTYTTRGVHERNANYFDYQKSLEDLFKDKF